MDCTSLTSFTILDPYCEIPDNTYAISNGYDENYNEYFTGTIYGYDNSTAQAYAEKYGYTFESLGAAPGATEPTTETTTSTTETTTSTTEATTSTTETTTTTPETTTTTPSTTTPTEPTYDIADVNGDGEIGVDDATDVLKNVAMALFGDGQLTDAQFKAADIDGNGELTVNDATLILKFAAAKMFDENVQLSDIL